jgi:hypothetical protein
MVLRKIDGINLDNLDAGASIGPIRLWIKGKNIKPGAIETKATDPSHRIAESRQ